MIWAVLYFVFIIAASFYGQIYTPKMRELYFHVQKVGIHGWMLSVLQDLWFLSLPALYNLLIRISSKYRGFTTQKEREQYLSCILNENDGKIRSLLVISAANKLDFGRELLLIVQPLPLGDLSCERMSEGRAWRHHWRNDNRGGKSAHCAFVVAHYSTNKKYRQNYSKFGIKSHHTFSASEKSSSHTSPTCKSYIGYSALFSAVYPPTAKPDSPQLHLLSFSQALDLFAATGSKFQSLLHFFD